MKHMEKCLLSVALLTLVGVMTASAGWVIYEPFDQTGLLPGQAGGNGLVGNWTLYRTGNLFTNVVGSLSVPSVPTRGNRLETRTAAGDIPSGGQQGLKISVAPTLSSAGLMDDGATLWFSFIVKGQGSNQNFFLAIGNTTQQYLYWSDNGDGIGVRLDNACKVYAAIYNGDTKVYSALESTYTTGDEYLVVGKIEWGSSSDTITVYTPDTADLALPAGKSISSVANLDQSTFDTLCIYGVGASPAIDEIRFGATYEDVITDPKPGTLVYGE